MPNPIQTVTASASSTTTVTATFGVGYNRPGRGNTLVCVAFMQYGPSADGTALPTISDSAGNTWTIDYRSTQSVFGGINPRVAIFHANLSSNAGSPYYSVSVGMNDGLDPGDDYITIAVFELPGNWGPDGLAAAHTGTGGSDSVGPQTPSQAGEFLAGVLAADVLGDTVYPPSGFTEAINRIYGDAGYKNLSNTAAVTLTWTDTGGATLRAAFQLYQSQPPISPPALTLALPLPAAMPGQETVAPPPTLSAVLPLPPQLNLPSAGADRPQATITLALLPAIVTSGTTVVSGVQPAASITALLPPTIVFTSKYPHLQIRHGPLAFEQTLPLLEGELYEAGIVVGNTVYELLYVGGHDGLNKLVGGGLQTVSGAPTFTPTIDAGSAIAVIDTTNNKLWVYINGVWKGVILA